jgi:hypothetical protein
MFYRKGSADVPHLIAVLPADNQSNDMAAPDTMKRVDSEILTYMGMMPIAGLEQDKQLRDMGITDGGQLRAFKPQDIAAKLGVDGLLYTVVENFNDINVGVYIRRIVEVKLKLVDAKGNVLWDLHAEGKTQEFNISPTSMAQAAVQGAISNVVGSQLEKMLKIHLLVEAQKAAAKVTRSIPTWPKSDMPAIEYAAVPGQLGTPASAAAAPSASGGAATSKATSASPDASSAKKKY